jgi:hypothetical protein
MPPRYPARSGAMSLYAILFRDRLLATGSVGKLYKNPSALRRAETGKNNIFFIFNVLHYIYRFGKGIASHLMYKNPGRYATPEQLTN